MIKGCSDGRKFDRKVGMDENEGRAEEGGYQMVKKRQNVMHVDNNM